MQNPIEKFRESSIVFEKPGILSDELQLPYSSVFFAETSHMFPKFPMPTKGWAGFFLFSLDLELFAKI